MLPADLSAVVPPLPAAVLAERQALRQRLLADRDRFTAEPGAASAAEALADHLAAVLSELAPECLGVYWPLGSEFNAARPWHGEDPVAALPLALPFAQRNPRAMHYRRWNGAAPELKDECGIATVPGNPVVPDVVLVPCLGYTDGGLRLGYGGGYFDRYLAAHPHITAVGVAWTVGRLADGELKRQPHDQPLMLVVTEAGVVG